MLTNVEPKVRKIIYMVFGFLALALGAVQVGFSAAELGQPTWLTVALAVFAFVSAGVGYTATSNTETREYELNLAEQADAEADNV